MNQLRVDAVVRTIRDRRAESLRCAEMAVETAQDEAVRARFRSDADAIETAYEGALGAIEDGDLAEALAFLVCASHTEKRGGDNHHSRDALTALRSLLSESTET